jgi:hypothetical protein
MTSSCSFDDCVEDSLIGNLQTGVCRLKEVDADRVITRVEHVVKANELNYDGIANNLLEGVVQPRDRAAKSLRRNSLGSYGGHCILRQLVAAGQRSAALHDHKSKFRYQTSSGKQPLYEVVILDRQISSHPRSLRLAPLHECDTGR